MVRGDDGESLRRGPPRSRRRWRGFGGLRPQDDRRVGGIAFGHDPGRLDHHRLLADRHRDGLQVTCPRLRSPLHRPFCGSRVPLFPDSERKSHTGRICALNAVSRCLEPLSRHWTHARNLPTESNSTSCHPSIAMSHLAPSKPGDLFPGEGLERSLLGPSSQKTVSQHSRYLRGRKGLSISQFLDCAENRLKC